jgi:DNA-binding PadR family transcriptional regulator
MNREPIRLSGTSYAVLSLLELLGPSTPYDLKRALGSSIENFWPVPHTIFYTEPARMANAGLLSERQELGGRRRKVYALTEDGRLALQEWAASPEIAAPQLREEGVLKIFAGADPVAIFRERSEWHRVRLAELEGYRRAVTEEPSCSEDPRWEGVRASLQFGVAYHRMLLEVMEGLLKDQPTTGSS